eukprot:scaffold59973_cov19-Tisochrysis_lutea.AAC.1
MTGHDQKSKVHICQETMERDESWTLHQARKRTREALNMSFKGHRADAGLEVEQPCTADAQPRTEILRKAAAREIKGDWCISWTGAFVPLMPCTEILHKAAARETSRVRGASVGQVRLSLSCYAQKSSAEVDSRDASKGRGAPDGYHALINSVSHPSLALDTGDQPQNMIKVAQLSLHSSSLKVET